MKEPRNAMPVLLLFVLLNLVLIILGVWKLVELVV